MINSLLRSYIFWQTVKKLIPDDIIAGWPTPLVPVEMLFSVYYKAAFLQGYNPKMFEIQFFSSFLMGPTKSQQTKCQEIIEKMISWPICSPFIELVDPERDGAPDCFDIIKHPTVLAEFKRKLQANE